LRISNRSASPETDILQHTVSTLFEPNLSHSDWGSFILSGWGSFILSMNTDDNALNCFIRKRTAVEQQM
jgi:hypothetical protein